MRLRNKKKSIKSKEQHKDYVIFYVNSIIRIIVQTTKNSHVSERLC